MGDKFSDTLEDTSTAVTLPKTKKAGDIVVTTFLTGCRGYISETGSS